MSSPSECIPSARGSPVSPVVSHNVSNDADSDPPTSNQSQSNSTHPTNQIVPKFLVMKHQDPEMKLSMVNPFIVSKALQGILGSSHQCKVTRLRSGHLLIEADRKHQAEILLKTRRLHDIPIQVEGHRNLNTSKGVIYCDQLRDLTNEEIKEELQDQYVTEVYRIERRQGNNREPTDTFIITFGKPTPPSEIKVAYSVVKVDTYIPSPRRCFRCQQYGHGQNNCHHDPVCAKCAQTGHEYNQCTNTPKCLHCQKDHPASSKDCPLWKIEKAIMEVKTRGNIPFKEARSSIYRTHQNLVNQVPKLKDYHTQTYSSVASSTSSPSATHTSPSTPTETHHMPILHQILSLLQQLIQQTSSKPIPQVQTLSTETQNKTSIRHENDSDLSSDMELDDNMPRIDPVKSKLKRPHSSRQHATSDEDLESAHSSKKCATSDRAEANHPKGGPSSKPKTAPKNPSPPVGHGAKERGKQSSLPTSKGAGSSAASSMENSSSSIPVRQVRSSSSSHASNRKPVTKIIAPPN